VSSFLASRAQLVGNEEFAIPCCAAACCGEEFAIRLGGCARVGEEVACPRSSSSHILLSNMPPPASTTIVIGGLHMGRGMCEDAGVRVFYNHIYTFYLY
jgi:hypothetical protein